MSEVLEFQKFVRPELLVLIPVLWAIGAGIKKTKLDNAWIPFVLAGASILLAVAYLFAFPSELNAGQIIVTGLIQGILCTALAVFGHQGTKQLSELLAKGKSE